MTWRQSMDRLRADRARIEALEGRRVWLHPSYVCCLLHRVSHYWDATGHRHLGRLLWHLNVILTGADIPPQADFGPGLLIPNPAGISIMGKSGRNLTVMPLAGIGGQLDRWEDVGAGQGLPVLGDDVYMEPYSAAGGPIRIGHRVRICSMVAATRDLPDDSILSGAEPRITRPKEGG